MILLSALLLALFVVQYFSQSTTTLRRMDTNRRIRSGLLSNMDMVNISHQRYSKRHYGLIWWRGDKGHYKLSCRTYMSTSGRLYKIRINGDGHRTVDYLSRDDILLDTRYYGLYTEEVEYLTNPRSNRPIFFSLLIRPALACL